MTLSLLIAQLHGAGATALNRLQTTSTKMNDSSSHTGKKRVDQVSFPWTLENAGCRQDFTSCTQGRQKHICIDVTAQTTASKKITTGSSALESWDTTASVNINNLFIQCCLFHMYNIFTQTKQYQVLSSDSVRLQPNIASNQKQTLPLAGVLTLKSMA